MYFSALHNGCIRLGSVLHAGEKGHRGGESQRNPNQVLFPLQLITAQRARDHTGAYKLAHMQTLSNTQEHTERKIASLSCLPLLNTYQSLMLNAFLGWNININYLKLYFFPLGPLRQLEMSYSSNTMDDYWENYLDLLYPTALWLSNSKTVWDCVEKAQEP